MTRLHYQGIHKHFGKRHLLRGAEVQLQAGKCLLLTGQNGAGKTTLMRILAGLEKPDQCQITSTAGSFGWKQYRNQLHERVMYLHQHPYLFEGTVYTNLAFALPRGLGRTEQQARIQPIAEWAGLTGILTSNAKTLSGGEAQRVAIARALLRNPQALLLDEPTANMDWQARNLTLDMVQKLKQDGLMLLVASHDPAFFQGVADEELQLG